MGAGKFFNHLKRMLHPERAGNEIQFYDFYDESGVLRLAVRPGDLYDIEAEGNYAVVRYTDPCGCPLRYAVRCRMHVLESRFDGTPLVRCSRGRIVNMEKVLSLRKEEEGYVLELKTGPVCVTRTYESRVLAYFARRSRRDLRRLAALSTSIWSAKMPRTASRSKMTAISGNKA